MFLLKSCQDAINFREISMNHFVLAETAIAYKIFNDDFGNEDWDSVDEVACKNVAMYRKNLRLQRHKTHVCYVDDVNTFLK